MTRPPLGPGVIRVAHVHMGDGRSDIGQVDAVVGIAADLLALLAGCDVGIDQHQRVSAGRQQATVPAVDGEELGGLGPRCPYQQVLIVERGVHGAH